MIEHCGRITTNVGLAPEKRTDDWPAAVVDDYRPWTDAEEDASWLECQHRADRRADR